MNYLPKRSIFLKKLNLELNSEKNNPQMYIHSNKFKSNILSKNKIRINISPNNIRNSRKISPAKNGINNESNHQNSSFIEFNSDIIKTNLTKKNTKINIIKNINSNKTKNMNTKNLQSLPISFNKTVKISQKNNKKIRKKYQYILTGTEILLNTNKKINKSNENKVNNGPRKSSKKFLRTQKFKNIINERKNISLYDKNENNNLNYYKEKSRIFLTHLLSTIPKYTSNDKITKVESKEINKEKKNNLENRVKEFRNNLTKSEYSRKIKKIKSKNILTNTKISPNQKEYKNTTYRIAEKESRNPYNDDYLIENYDIYNKTYYLDEDEVIRDLLLNTNEKSPKNKNRVSLINKVLYFNTESNNHIFNLSIKNQEIDISSPKLEKTYGYYKIEMESPKTSNQNYNNNTNIIKNGKNKFILNQNSIYKNYLKNIINKKKNVKRKNFEKLKLKQYNTLVQMKGTFIKKQIKKSYNNTENSTINQDHKLHLRNIIKLKNNKNFMKRTNKIKYINLSKKIQNFQTLNKIERKNIFYELFECNNFIKILFSFCESDINLLNKISILSKEIFKKMKPLIYKKISNIINQYNKNNNLRNKIKERLMKNNSLLGKISNSILYIKYNDLLFENNKYDIEIKKDLTRTFPKNILFKYGNINYNKLYHILSAFSNLNKNIGYVQGINYIAAHIINIFENEIDGLIFLDSLINKFQLDKIFDNNLNNEFYNKICNNINSFIIKQMPKFDKFLSDAKLNIEFFTANWILTLFADSIDTEFIVIIWDYMIIFRWKFVKYFILNILLMFENDILNTEYINLTYFKKNIFRNEKFKTNFHKSLIDTEQMMINDDNII